MAIDSRDKRASATGFRAPVPDGSLGSEHDRRQVVGLYRLGPGNATALRLGGTLTLRPRYGGTLEVRNG